jgi:glycosyltransferase involved in cell wall biosynthesis
MVGRLGVAFLAPTPPPVMGPSIATRVVLSEPPPTDIALCHIDTADRRSLETLGRVDAKNLWDALSAYARLLWVLVTKRPRLVYVPLSQTTVGFLRDSGHVLLATLFRRRVLLHLRGGYFRAWYDEECSGFMRAWVRFILRRTHGVIVLGETLRPLFRGLVPEEAIHVVPNGEDYPELADVRRACDGRTAFRILFLGNLIPTKGPGELLRAVPGILARHPGTRFVFAGAWRDESLRTWATAFVREQGIERAVEFAGAVERDRKAELLRESDLLVFPTYYRNEGQPWVIVEALAAGLPVISTDHASIRECVVHGKNGLLVPKRDPAAVAAAVLDLLDHPERLDRMGRESRALHAARFNRTSFRRGLFQAMRAAAAGEGGSVGQSAQGARACG